MPHARLFAVGIVNSVKAPAVVTRPILVADADSVNHSAPSGPAVIFRGKLPDVGMINSVITPAVVICAILLPPSSPNHRLLSGPVATFQGRLPAVLGKGNS